jgi:ABC-type branched-subunit amino acid transport system substrate-binding protein
LNSELAYVESSVSYFNAHDSVCGHKFEIRSFDDKGDPALALSQAKQLVSEGVTIMTDDSVGGAQDAIQPYLMQQHMLIPSGHTSFLLNNPAKNPTDFLYLPSTAQDAKMMVDWAKSHNMDNIGILTDGRSLSNELAGYTATNIQKAGLTLVKTVTYSPTSIDLTPQLTEVKQAGAKVLIIAGYTGILRLVSGLNQMGWAPPLLAWSQLRFYGLLADKLPAGSVEGCWPRFGQGEAQSKLLTPAVMALLQDYADRQHGITPATPGVLMYYTALLMAKHAIEKANSIDGLKMAEVLNKTTNLPTLIPGYTVSFSPTNHAGFPDSYLAMCPLVPGPYAILTAGS